jgi:hypothetical protein
MSSTRTAHPDGPCKSAPRVASLPTGVAPLQGQRRISQPSGRRTGRGALTAAELREISIDEFAAWLRTQTSPKTSGPTRKNGQPVPPGGQGTGRLDDRREDGRGLYGVRHRHAEPLLRCLPQDPHRVARTLSSGTCPICSVSPACPVPATAVGCGRQQGGRHSGHH